MANSVLARRSQAPTRIAVAFLLIMAVGYFGYGIWSSYMIDRAKFDPIAPGTVSLVGVKANAGYYITVSNQVAQLVEGEAGELDAPDEIKSRESGSERKRIPLKDMLESMQGDEAALGRFIASMNRLPESDVPDEVVWDAADIQKALDGDAALLSRLKSDLSVDLEGNPMPTTTGRAIENGIGIRLKIPISFKVGPSTKTIEGTVQVEYRPTFTSAVWDHLKDKFNQSKELVAGYYAEEAARLKENPNQKENVRLSLEAQISPDRIKRFATGPQRLLNNSTIVANGELMESATFEEQPLNEGKREFKLKINMKDEGRKRLWQYSKKHVGDQLLLVMDGIAIAAPRIEHDLAQGEVTITRLPDEGLVKEFVDLVNAQGGGK